MMKRCFLCLIALTVFIAGSGCTRIVKLEPSAGPAGSPVWVKTKGLWGSPCDFTLKWDGETICKPFSGSFTVPAVAQPGEHRITLVDKVDADEACLVFPLFRLRHSWATFTVTE